MGILRTLRVFALIALLPIWAYAMICQTTGSCTKIDCSGYASGKKSAADGEIDREFQKLKKAVEELKKQYNNYLEKYKDSVKLYKKLQELKKYNSLKLDEVNYYMEKTNKMLEIKILEAGEKGILE